MIETRCTVLRDTDPDGTPVAEKDGDVYDGRAVALQLEPDRIGAAARTYLGLPLS